MGTKLPVGRATMGLLGVAAVLLVFVPASWFTAGEYGAYAAGIQAAGVLLALIFAYITLGAQNRAATEALRSQEQLDRVSRTLGFHEAMVTGEIQGARIRLIDYLRAHGDAGATCPMSVEQLRTGDYRSVNVDQAWQPESYLHTPIHDVNVVLRFFERAEPALTSGLVDEALFHKLLGRHIAWWDEAIIADEGEAVRHALSQLAAWVWDYGQRNPLQSEYVSHWISNMTRDFPTGRYTGWRLVP
jgi:hypothetical protein